MPGEVAPGAPPAHAAGQSFSLGFVQELAQMLARQRFV
jgi:hypothetical protein